MFVDDGEEQLIVDTTLEHAKAHHPDLAANRAEAETAIRSHITDLLRQSKYYEQKSMFTDHESGGISQALPGLS